MANALGTATLDFGAWPGSNEAQVVIGGQSAISAGSYTGVFPMAEASGAHTLNDSTYAFMWIAVTCTAAVAGVGFTVLARSAYSFTGTFVIRWVWSD